MKLAVRGGDCHAEKDATNAGTHSLKYNHTFGHVLV